MDGARLSATIRLVDRRKMISVSTVAASCSAAFYAFAVKALLGPEVSISASLLYPRTETDLQLVDPEATLAELTGYLQSASASLSAGHALIGPDTGGTYDDLAFALPANTGATYCKRKTPAATDLVGDAALVWGAQ